MAVIDLTDKPTAASNASAGIVKIIEAMADAKTSQTELQKQLMLHQIQTKMDLQENAAKLQQGVESNINQKQANLNWATGSPLDAVQTGGNGLNSNGQANGQTPSSIVNPTDQSAQSVVSPVGGAMPAMTQPQAPAPMTMANPSLQATNNAESQMSMAPQPAAQPMPIPANSPIGKPLPPPQGRVIMGPDGKPILNPNANSADNQTYAGIYNKWKSGTPLSDGESKWVQTKFRNGPDGQPLAKNNADASTEATAGMTPFQKGILNIKSKMGPQYTLDGDGNVIQDPIYMSLIKAKQDAQANVEAHEPEVQQARQDRLYNQAVSDIVNKQASARYSNIGVQDAKTNAALHARQLIDGAFDPKTGQYNITQVPYGELTETLGSILGGTGGSSEGRIDALKQKTLLGQINNSIAYLTSNPTNANSQTVIKQLVSMIDRQGLESSHIRDSEMMNLKHEVLDGSGLNQDKKDIMFNSHNLGLDYGEELKRSPDYQYNNPQSFKSEDEAKAAGLADGTRIKINGQTGTWRS